MITYFYTTKHNIFEYKDMNGTKFVVCNIILWLITSSKLLTRAEERLNNSQISLYKTRSLKIFPGIKFFLTDSKINIHVRVHNLLQETDRQARKNKDKDNPLQKLGFMMMMTPFIMQILSLPGAIATIKISLLRSIMVAQLAIAIMFYNLIRSSQNSEEVVVIHRPYHPTHYRHSYPDNEEDEWFGR